MDSEIIETVTGWDGTTFSGGYAGLHDLADREFTGALSDGTAWAFMLNGKVVGVFDGGIESFEGADGTAYSAPDPALPLLYAMQATGGETRAKYYSNDTPLKQADSTLSAGNFTGYVELSENVLSGDYYVVYYGGKSMSAAFVGNSRKLLTGDEAFERADGEVGIYEVKSVDIHVVDVPEPAEPAEPTEPAAGAGATAADSGDESTNTGAGAPGAAGAAGAAGGAAGVSFGDSDADDGAGEAAATANEPATNPDGATETAAGGADDGATVPTTGTAETPGTSAPREATADAEPEPEPESERRPEQVDNEGDERDERDERDAAESPESTESAEPADATRPEVDQSPSESPEPVPSNREDGESDQSTEPAEPAGSAEPTEATEPTDAAESADSTSAAAAAGATSAAAAGSARNDSDVFSEEAQWREAKTVPALDPKASSDPSEEGQSGGPAVARKRAQRRRTEREKTAAKRRAEQRRRQRQQQRQRDEQRRQAQSSASTTDESRGPAQPRHGDVEQLQARLKAATAAKDDLESEVERLRGERDESRAEVERLESRVADLESEVERLEADLNASSGGSAAETLSPTAALEGTNLFIRYGSKSGGTLEKAHAGDVDRDEVNQNLRLEHHTTFETEGLHVDGQPYESFLHGTIEYGFVRWVVEDLLYEIGETGNHGSLDQLFDAIPQIDRAELDGTVSLRYQSEGEEHREQQTFDVVLRDRMGNPLLVANLNDSRRAAAADEMEALVTNASRLRESNESLGGAFFVTASFFDPEALEVAADATGGGLLSRGRRKSFVKLSRKQGFHLCLVETRNGEFHVNVPEL